MDTALDRMASVWITSKVFSGYKATCGDPAKSDVPHTARVHLQMRMRGGASTSYLHQYLAQYDNLFRDDVPDRAWIGRRRAAGHSGWQMPCFEGSTGIQVAKQG